MNKNIWFTSDTHFSHKRILEFCPNTRMGSSVADHDEILIENWNQQVKTQDTVYLLGDCFFLRDPCLVIHILQRLNGHKHLVYGNHDKVIRKNASVQAQFESIQEYAELRMGNNLDVILFHYPLLEWNKMHYGSYHLFGHVHGNMDYHPEVLPYRMMDVGIDSRPGGVAPQDGKMTLWNWEQIDSILKQRAKKNHHGD